MGGLDALLQGHVDQGLAPGAVALVADQDRLEVAVVGSRDVDGSAAMTRDTIFRIASITKPLTAVAALVLVEDGAMALGDRVDRWLPELASPVVVRTPASPVDDVVPAHRPVTVADLLTFRAGWGFGPDFTLPAVQALFGVQRGPWPQLYPPPDAWLAALARVPMLHQPGEAWLYNTCSDVLGVLIARVAGRPFPEVLSERLLEPLGMVDTGFEVPDGSRDRLAAAYRPTEGGGLELADAPDGQWSRPVAFPSGAAGLVSTVDDWYAFGRFLLGDGTVSGRRLLSGDALRQLTTDHLSGPQRAAGELFLEGQGWGYGGSVDVTARDPWNSPGRYGWVGGTGTAGHVVPRTGTVTVLLTQRELTGPTSTPLMREFWTYAARTADVEVTR